MSNVLTPGRYKTTVTSCALRRRGTNNLLCVSLYFRGDEGKDGDDYIPIDGEWGIIGDFYIEKKDGSLNEDQIKKLAHVFDWDGDLNSLGSACTGARCKLTVKNDTYNGKTRPKADWIDHIDAGDEGFALEWDATTARAAQASIGGKIRAILGPKKPAPQTATPPVTAASAGPPRKNSSANSTPPSPRVSACGEGRLRLA